MSDQQAPPPPHQNAQWEFEGVPDDDDQSQGASDDELQDDPFTRKELGAAGARLGAGGAAGVGGGCGAGGGGAEGRRAAAGVCS